MKKNLPGHLIKKNKPKIPDLFRLKKETEKISSISRFSLLFFSLSILFASCAEKKTTDEYVARVNNSFLTKREVNNYLKKAGLDSTYFRTYIVQWINNEILYQESVRNDILSDSLFVTLTQNSKRNLASALYIQKLLETQKFSTSNLEIENYYTIHKEEFILNQQTYLINETVFTSERAAINFRRSAVAKGWNIALFEFQKNPDLFYKKSSELVNRSQIIPEDALRSIDRLSPYDVTYVLKKEKPLSFSLSEKPETKLSYYYVFQLIRKFNEGESAPLDFVKEEISSRIIAEKRENFLRKFLSGLYSNYIIENKIIGTE